MMAGDDISKLYNIDVSDYEYAAVKEKYGSIFLWHDYINAGMLLFNMKKVRETGLLEKARKLIKTKKFLFADQTALYKATTSKLLLPRRFNEQASFKRDDTVICHFCKRLVLRPYPHTTNFKQWDIGPVHDILRCFRFDEDLEEYLKLKEEFEKEKVGEK